MSIPTSIAFIDGENLVFRYQALLDAGGVPRKDVVHIKDTFVWSPRVTKWCMMNLRRVYYYMSAIGDDVALTKIKETIASTKFRYDYTDDAEGHGQLVPVIFKKPAKSYKTRQVDIQITIDMMRFAHNDAIDALYLVSGDGDYLPLMREVMRYGKEVYVAALSSGMSRELRFSADDFQELDSYFFEKPEIKTIKPKVPKLTSAVITAPAARDSHK